MRTKYLLFLALLLYLNAYGQEWIPHIISTDAAGAVTVHSDYIDNDSWIDVISASNSDDKVTWYRNTDGEGTFVEQTAITMDAGSARGLWVADLDGDGDNDVISSGDFKIAWYENTDGNGNFGPQQIITTDIDGAVKVFAADLDGDTDLDVLSASQYDHKVAWYENTDGNGNFGNQILINVPPNAEGAKSVYAIDIDGDSDLDVLSGSDQDDKVAWYENDGNGNFGQQHIISDNADSVITVHSDDIDGDGDMDVLSASCNDNKVAWYENDGNGNFGPEQIISTNTSCADVVYAMDIDGDGNLDVLSASAFDNKIAWYYNTDGHGNFGGQHIITTDADFALFVYAADINEDGKMDVLSASFFDNKIAWYEQGVLEVEENSLLDFYIYPNPVNQILNIKAEETIYSVSIANILGQEIYSSNVEAIDTTIDLSSYAMGTYFVKVQFDESIITEKIIKK